MEEQVKSSVSHRKLRRIAERVPEVSSRHQGNAALASRAPALLLAATAFAEASDALAAFVATSQSIGKQSAARVGDLYDRLHMWVATLSRDVTGFSGATHAGDSAVPDDVIVDARNLLEAVQAYGETHGPIPYASQLVADLQQALEPAEAALRAAQAAYVRRQEL